MDDAFTSLTTYAPALPEIIMALGALTLLIYGVFREGNAAKTVEWLTLFVLAAAGWAIMAQPSGEQTLFNGSFVSDDFSRFMKLLALAASGFSILMASDYLRRMKMDHFEFPVLILFAVLGMMVMISAGGLIALYLGLELQSLALYVVAAYRRDSVRSSEAGLKYFVLGALSSGMLLYGASLVYGFTGAITFTNIASAAHDTGNNLGLTFGLVFLLAGIAFKISAVPFHMWAPDVYQGAPTPITAFFAGAPKVAAIAMLLRVTLDAFPAIANQWQQIIIFLSVASMGLGAFAAIGQTNIKRLMAYSSIGHMGFALVGLAAASQNGTRAVLIYLAIYVVMTLGTFACILAMRRSDGMVEDINELKGLARNDPTLAFLLGSLLFSLAGIPWLAGFFGKYFVFLAAIEAQLYALAIFGVLASVVGAFYYLRIVKMMYFDDATEPFEPMTRPLRLVLVLSGIFVHLYIFYPLPLVETANAAAKSFF